MNHLDALRAPILSSYTPQEGYVVKRIFFDPAHGDSTVEWFAGRPAALDRFVHLCGGEFTEAAAVRVIAEGGFYRPTHKVKLETLRQYRLLYGPASLAEGPTL